MIKLIAFFLLSSFILVDATLTEDLKAEIAKTLKPGEKIKEKTARIVHAGKTVTEKSTINKSERKNVHPQDSSKVEKSSSFQTTTTSRKPGNTNEKVEF